MIDLLANDTFLTLVAINVIAAIGMNIVYVTGQLNLGQAGFAAVGAYTVAVIDVELGWPLALTLAAGALAAALVAVPVAIGANRIRGIYLIMGTLAAGELIRITIGNIDPLGGLQGYSGQSPVSTVGVFSALAVVTIIAVALMSSRLGLRMRSIFDDEHAAASAGVATRRVKIGAVVMSAAVVAVAGGLLAKWLLFIAPREFGIDLSFEIALYTLVGGVHSLLGAVVGAATISVLLEVLRKTPDLDWMPSAFHFLSNWRLVVLGVLVMVVMAVLPEGLVGRRVSIRLTAPFRDIRDRLVSARRTPATATTPADGPVLALDGVSHRFGGVTALRDVDFAVHAGEIVALIGGNGAGKTTLIDVASGSLPCQSGTISLEGRDVTELRPEARTRLGIARTFQNVRVFAHLTVAETVRLGHLAARDRSDHGDVLDLVGLTGHSDVLPDRLTLAQRRRLEVGRAVASQPTVVLLDEPSVGMNDAERRELADLVEEIRERGIAVVIVDHNLDLALGVADRVVVLDFGDVIAEGTATEILQDPKVREAYLGSADRGMGFDEVTP